MRSVLICLAVVPALLPAVPADAAGFTYERVTVPMRDGVELSVDIWRPDTTDPVPVIATLTPYHVLYKALDRNEQDLPHVPADGIARRYVPRGYAYVLADVRGTYNSGGCWDYGGINERQDGYDLVEWLGTRGWSNGKVALTGGSYDGTTANAAAVEAPPHLATIVPVSAISRWWGYAYQQGARSTYSGESLDADPPSDTPADFMAAYGMAPPPDRFDNAQQVAMRWNLCDRVEQALRGYDTEPDYDAFWTERDYLRLADRVTAPALVAHGFRDFNVKTWEGTAWFQELEVPKMLVAGQWAHAYPASFQWQLLLDRWFERWLLDVPNGVEDEPSVWVTSNRSFRQQDAWGEGPAATYPLSGDPFTYPDDGVLTESEMLRGLGEGDRFVRVPVPGTKGIHIEGRPVLHLSASTDSPSTHLVAVLCDTAPTGECDVISRAFFNARYHASLEQGEDLVPGQRYTFSLEFIDKDWELDDDHHLELLIGSSSTTWVVSDERRATNTLFFEDSSLEVPVR